MTQKQAKEFLPFIQAMADGETIQYRYSEAGKWADIDNPSFSDSRFKYRVKPKPTYRSFENANECWEEMKKHEPFGWIIKQPTISVMIDCVSEHSIRVDGSLMNFSSAFDLGYTFIDGAPFGIKQEE